MKADLLLRYHPEPGERGLRLAWVRAFDAFL